MVIDGLSMKTADAISHFKTAAALADALGATRGAVSQWGEDVPELSAAKLEKITDGALVYDYEHYRRQDATRRKQAA